MRILYDKPPIHFSAIRGGQYIKANEILQSKKGQETLRKVAKMRVRRETHRR